MAVEQGRSPDIIGQQIAREGRQTEAQNPVPLAYGESPGDNGDGVSRRIARVEVRKSGHDLDPSRPVLNEQRAVEISGRVVGRDPAPYDDGFPDRHGLPVITGVQVGDVRVGRR